MAKEKEITIYDIARHLNISATTVSRGLKNHPAINKNTRKKIAETARELGYRSNTFASSLRSKQTHTIGVIVHRLNSYFAASALAGMEDVATKRGYTIIIGQSLEDAKKEIANVETMFNKRVDGLLVSLAYNTADTDHFEPFIRKGIPVVFYDRVQTDNECTKIIIDNFKAAYESTQHLIGQGCKRIMHLGGAMLRNVYSERKRGYKKALEDNGIPFDKSLVHLSLLNEESGTEAAEAILKMKDRPDGVFAANDTSAVYCMLRLKEAGIRIPEDIAFVGFNNDPISKVIEPNLTTTNYSGYAIGETAAMSLIDRLTNASNAKSTATIILRSELIIRNSSLKKDGAN
jgi:LacI family transcriptional regulator